MFKYLAQIKEKLDTTGRADTWRAPPPFWFYNLMRGKTSIYNMHATVDKTQLSRSARHFTIDYYCHNQGTVYRGTVCRRYTNCKKYEYTSTAEWVYSARYSGCNQQEASGTEHHVIKLEDFSPHFFPHIQRGRESKHRSVGQGMHTTASGGCANRHARVDRLCTLCELTVVAPQLGELNEVAKEPGAAAATARLHLPVKATAGRQLLPVQTAAGRQQLLLLLLTRPARRTAGKIRITRGGEQLLAGRSRRPERTAGGGGGAPATPVGRQLQRAVVEAAALV